MRLNVEVKGKLYKDFWQFASLEGFSSISEAIRALMVDYIRKRKLDEGVVPLHGEEEQNGRKNTAS